MKFKNYIEVQSGIKDSANSPGTLDQVLTSTATGVAWVDPSTISAEAATLVVIECKNTSGATITKGTPVYQTGTVGATDVIEIAPADALISAGAQPAIGLLQTTLNNNGFGKVVITGEFLNFTTDPIDGVTPTTGDKVFLKSGGGLTLTKPTGEGNGIQNLGLIGKVSGGNAGSITVSSIMRTNDVPNLPTGKIWVGDGNTIVSDTVYLDEPNGRMGIGTTSPNSKLDIIQTTDGSGVRIYGYDDRSTEYLRIGDNGSSGVYGATGNVKLESGGTGYVFLDSNNDIFFDVGSSGFNFRFRDGAGNELVRIKGNGNVGIGTTSPSQKLEVIGRTKITQSGDALRINSSDANGPYVTWQNNGSNIGYIGAGYHLWSSPNNIATSLGIRAQTRLDLGIQASVYMTILNSGNVGIGVTGPSYKLDVNGIIRSENSSEVGTLYLGNTAQSQIPGGAIIGQRSPNYSSTGNLLFQVPTWGANTDYGLTTQMSIEVSTSDTKEATISMIPFGGDVLITAALLSNQDNTDVDTGTETVAQVSTTDYTAAFFDFVVKKGTNVRSGTVYACHDGTNVEFTETSTNDLGDTSDVTLSVDISGGNMRLLATVTSDDWSVKSLIRAI